MNFFNEKDLYRILKRKEISPSKKTKLKGNYFFDNFRKEASEKIDKKNFQHVESSSKRIFDKIQKNAAEGKKRVGILLGKIQSGKTLNFLSLMCVAFDGGYDICIVLNTNNISIANQNVKRIENCFKKTKEEEKVKILSPEENKFDGEEGSALYERWIKEGNKLIMLVRKNKKWLEETHEFVFRNKKLFSGKCLIIDDEGDEASLNNNALKESRAPSKINQLINGIREKLPDHDYIFVTATPFAPILLEKRDIMSPEFVELIYPGKPYEEKKYYGISEYWDEESDIYKKTVKIIGNKDIETLAHHDPAILPPSLIRSISTFLVGAALLNFENGTKYGYEMIVHFHTRLLKQEIIFDKLSNFLQQIRKWFESNDSIENKELDEFISEGLHELLKKGKRDIEKKLYERIKKDVKDNIDACKIVKLNSKNEKKGIEKSTTNKIYIGALSIGRGLTFEKLTVTYITNRAKGSQGADTTLQRARWFGYKKEIDFEFSRVFCTEQIDDDYKYIKLMEEELWEDIENLNNDPSLKFSDWLPSGEGGFLLGSEKLWPTRRNVARQIKYKPSKLYITYTPIKNDADEENFYKSSLEDREFKDTKEIYDKREHKEREFANLQELSNYVGKKTFFRIMTKKCLCIGKVLKKFLEWSVENSIRAKIIIMRPNEKGQYRTLKFIPPNQEIVQIFSGETSQLRKKDIKVTDIFIIIPLIRKKFFFKYGNLTCSKNPEKIPSFTKICSFIQWDFLMDFLKTLQWLQIPKNLTILAKNSQW